MSTCTTQFLVSIPTENESPEERQFLLNLAVSLEAATVEEEEDEILVTLCLALEVIGKNLVPCSPGPPLENPNPGG